MYAIIWLATASLLFACFYYFIYMLYKVRDIGHYNYLTALLAAIFLMFSIFAAVRAIGMPAAPFEFIGIFLLLVLAIIQLREEVLGHEFD